MRSQETTSRSKSMVFFTLEWETHTKLLTQSTNQFRHFLCSHRLPWEVKLASWISILPSKRGHLWMIQSSMHLTMLLKSGESIAWDTRSKTSNLLRELRQPCSLSQSLRELREVGFWHQRVRWDQRLILQKVRSKHWSLKVKEELKRPYLKPKHWWNQSETLVMPW